MNFKLVGEISLIKTIAVGRAIREYRRLEKVYGKARWRKLKGVAMVRFPDGTIMAAEVHWYEAHGLGRKEIKVKRYWNLS